MRTTTKAIVLSSLKYGDSSLIVRAYTESDGLKSYLLKGVLSSRKGKVKAAYFLPLMQLELVANHRNKGSLEHLSEVRVSVPYQSLHTEQPKNSLVLFLAEMLGNSIQEQQRDPALFRYLEYALQWLDTHGLSPDFHILFLLNLSRYLGFYPDTRLMEAPYFDLQEGEFCIKPSLNPLIEGELLGHFRAFLGVEFEALDSIKTGRAVRRKLLQRMILYYKLQLHGFREPKSLAVLSAVFG